MTAYISNAAAIVAIDAITALVDAGSGAGEVRIYAGTIPAAGDAALGGATLLATLVMSATAFGAGADVDPGGACTAAAITSATAVDTGTASFFRLGDSDVTPIFQGTVGTSATDMILDAVAIASGATVSLSSFVLTQPES